MKSSGRIFARLALPLFMICLLASFSKATTVVMLSDKELAVQSRFILTGEVKAVTSAWDDDGSMIWTYVEIYSGAVLKGELPTRRIVLKQPGGMVGGQGVEIFGQPEFLKGQEVLLYLTTGPDGALRVAHSFMGLYYVVDDPATGKKIITRRPEQSEVQVLSRTDNETVTDRADLEDHLQSIKQTLLSEAAQVEQVNAELWTVPALAEPREYQQKKSESKKRPGAQPDFAFMSSGVRWMEADSGQAVTFHINPSRSPVSGGGSNELSRAMSAWSNQSSASIRLQLGSQSSGCGLVGDGTNTISFGDCLGQLDTPSGCSGVVAITQIFWTSESKVVGGRSFKRLVEADLVFNKGMDCFLGNSSNLAEVACHEIGHAIGLAHSSDSGAIMWASARGGRDATLGQDDKNGVQAIYPGSGGGTGGGSGGGTGGGSGGGPGGGTGGGEPVSITTLTMNEGVVGGIYKMTLRASGGVAPYNWSIASGRLPQGLKLSDVGQISGVPTVAGVSSLLVKVSDSTGSSTNIDIERLTITIRLTANNPAPLPIVSRVKVKKSKKLFVYGANFTRSSMIQLNGLLITPKKAVYEGESDQLTYKGQLSLRGTGSNRLIVLNADGSSDEFVF